MISKNLHSQFREKKHIIFDFDETLCTIQIDWQGWITGTTQLLRKYDPAFDPSTVYIWAEVENAYVQKHGLKLHNEIRQFNHDYELKYTKGFIKHRHALDLVTKLNHVSFSLWTSNSYDTIAPMLRELKLFNKFSIIVSRDEVTYLKPHHEGFAHIFKKHPLPLSKFLFIGDSRADELAAIAVGIDFLHVSKLVTPNSLDQRKTL